MKKFALNHIDKLFSKIQTIDGSKIYNINRTKKKSSFFSEKRILVMYYIRFIFMIFMFPCMAMVAFFLQSLSNEINRLDADLQLPYIINLNVHCRLKPLLSMHKCIRMKHLNMIIPNPDLHLLFFCVRNVIFFFTSGDFKHFLLFIDIQNRFCFPPLEVFNR